MRGEVVYLYAFDVANEIVTRDVRNILGLATTVFEPRAAHTLPRDLPLYRALTATLERDLTVNERRAVVRVRVYEVGVVAISIAVAVDASSLSELASWHHPRLRDGGSLDAWTRDLCGEVCASLGPALLRSSVPSQPEAYTVFCLAEVDAVDAAVWFDRERRAIAGLLAQADPQALSEPQIDESLRIHRSYTRGDFVVVDWDASLVVEQDGYFDDVLYVLELANLQLEEFRVMDERLDRHLERAYRDLERARGGMWRAPTAMLAWLRQFRIDVTKLADEVSHITKFFGDWYLARVYLGARERFHLDPWRLSVDHRLQKLDELYRMLHADVVERRMLWLEVAVVVCFIVDLLALFFWKR
ncbi:MAG: hypothetical protein U0939_08800 [Pirellulales bacterium]